jgi:hypothetical protein
MDLASSSVTGRAPSRAAQCIRVPTGHQEYSPESQIEVICRHAATDNMDSALRVLDQTPRR